MAMIMTMIVMAIIITVIITFESITTITIIIIGADPGMSHLHPCRVTAHTGRGMTTDTLS